MNTDGSSALDEQELTDPTVLEIVLTVRGSFH